MAVPPVSLMYFFQAKFSILPLFLHHWKINLLFCFLQGFQSKCTSPTLGLHPLLTRLCKALPAHRELILL